MTAHDRSITIILLVYFLYGAINYLAIGVFLLPVPYSDLVVLALVLTLFIFLQSSINLSQIALLIYAVCTVMEKPFLWELFMDQQQLERLFAHEEFVRLPIIGNVAFCLFLLSFWYGVHGRLLLLWRIMVLASIGMMIASWEHKMGLYTADLITTVTVIAFTDIGLMALLTMWILRNQGDYPSRPLLNVLVSICLVHVSTIICTEFMKTM